MITYTDRSGTDWHITYDAATSSYRAQRPGERHYIDPTGASLGNPMPYELADMPVLYLNLARQAAMVDLDREASKPHIDAPIRFEDRPRDAEDTLSAITSVVRGLILYGSGYTDTTPNFGADKPARNRADRDVQQIIAIARKGTLT